MEWLVAAAFAFEAAGTWIGMDAAEHAADLEEDQARLNANQARIGANVSAVNRITELRYNLGLNEAAMTAGSLGEGEDFLAMRRHEIEQAQRDLRAINLNMASQITSGSTRAQYARMRADNARIAGFFSLGASAASAGVDFYNLSTGDTDGPR